MSTCKNCLHAVICPYSLAEVACDDFKDRSKFIELPYIFDLDEVAELYEDMVRCGIEYKNGNNLGREIQGTGDLLLDSDSILKTMFLTEEEAEQALTEREKDNGK